MENKSLSIIIPAYNEDAYIQSVIDRVIHANSLGLKKEIIIVNDGSTDDTESKVYKVLKSVKSKKLNDKKNFSIRIIYKKQNEGKSAAIKSGILKSTGDIVLIQDADLEYNPQDYPTLLEPFFTFHADVVYGSRFVSNRPRRILYFWHYITNIFLTTFSNMFTNLNLSDMETGYKVFRGEIIRKIALNLESKRFGFEPEITARISKIPNLNLYEVGISYQGRTYAEGKKINWIDGVKAVWEIIKFNLLTK